MQDLSYQILERRQKMHIKAYVVLCFILLISIGGYSYTKWKEYSLIREGIKQNESLITLKREEVQDEKNSYESKKNTYDALNKDIEGKLETLFPASDDYTALTRAVDTYEQELAKKNDPFEISNIDYQNPIQNDNYSILPMRMNIRSSVRNFTKFLQLIENSGALDSDVRLMDISSIRLNFNDGGDEENKTEEINFSIQINAYFQKIQ